MTPDPVAERFALTDSESLALTLAKLSLMETDLEGDPDHSDRVNKRPVVRRYSQLFLTSMIPEWQVGAEVGWRAARERAASVAARVRDGDGARALASALQGLGHDAARYVMTSPDITASALGGIDQRRRAIVLMIELGAFSPWPHGTRWETEVRRRGLEQLVDAMAAPVDSGLMGEIDRRLSSSVRRLSRKHVDKKRIAVIAAGGVAIGALTGGLAAPLIGSAVGGAMGLSGAAATSAGLALLGGGSVAAGGLGVAGGTAVIAGLTGMGAAGAGAAGTFLRGAPVDDVVVESAKLAVLVEYLTVREEKDEGLQQLVVHRLQEQIAWLAAECNDLTRLLAHQQAEVAARTELTARLNEEVEKRRVLERTLEELRRLTRGSSDE